MADLECGCCGRAVSQGLPQNIFDDVCGGKVYMRCSACVEGNLLPSTGEIFRRIWAEYLQDSRGRIICAMCKTEISSNVPAEAEVNCWVECRDCIRKNVSKNPDTVYRGLVKLYPSAKRTNGCAEFLKHLEDERKMQGFMDQGNWLDAKPSFKKQNNTLLADMCLLLYRASRADDNHLDSMQADRMDKAFSTLKNFSLYKLSKRAEALSKEGYPTFDNHKKITSREKLEEVKQLFEEYEGAYTADNPAEVGAYSELCGLLAGFWSDTNFKNLQGLLLWKSGGDTLLGWGDGKKSSSPVTKGFARLWITEPDLSKVVKFSSG